MKPVLFQWIIRLFVLSTTLVSPSLFAQDSLNLVDKNSKLLIIRHADDDPGVTRHINYGGEIRSRLEAKALAEYTVQEHINPIGTILYIEHNHDEGTIKPRETAQAIHNNLGPSYCEYATGCVSVEIDHTFNWDEPEQVNEDIMKVLRAQPQKSVLLVEVSHALRHDSARGDTIDKNIFYSLTRENTNPVKGQDLHGHSDLWVVQVNPEKSHQAAIEKETTGQFLMSDGESKQIDKLDSSTAYNLQNKIIAYQYQ